MLKTIIVIILAGCFIVTEFRLANETMATLGAVQQQQAAVMDQIAKVSGCSYCRPQ